MVNHSVFSDQTFAGTCTALQNFRLCLSMSAIFADRNHQKNFQDFLASFNETTGTNREFLAEAGTKLKIIRFFDIIIRSENIPQD